MKISFNNPHGKKSVFLKKFDNANSFRKFFFMSRSLFNWYVIYIFIKKQQKKISGCKIKPSLPYLLLLHSSEAKFQIQCVLGAIGFSSTTHIRWNNRHQTVLVLDFKTITVRVEKASGLLQLILNKTLKGL